MKEFELIEKIKQLSNNCNKTSNVNIGDDCAVLKNLSDEKDILVTTDILVENIHFSLKYYSFYDVGYKSAQVNISDIICKGAFPKSVFVNLQNASVLIRLMLMLMFLPELCRCYLWVNSSIK